MITDSMKAHLVESAQEVFQTMVAAPMVAGALMDGATPHGEADIAATVGVTGPVCALVTCYSTTPVARTITSCLLGVDEMDVHGEIPDAMGEVANMIAGTFRNRMAEDGGEWAITIPSVVVGQGLTMTYAGGVRRVLCPFTAETGTFFVELVITPED